MKYYGKYRAIVVEINDPEKRGRIKVKCPSVLGESRSNWCEPCVPVAYDNGGDFCLPKVGETTWIEFEAGDPNMPIYVGNWWSREKTPSLDYASDVRIISHDGSEIKFSVDDIKITASGVTLILNQQNITNLNEIIGYISDIRWLNQNRSNIRLV